MIQIKRTYEPTAESDGQRVLVERLWPRGLTKAKVAADEWLKDVAPSTELRKWFDHQEERWDGFCERYRKELAANPEAWKPLLQRASKGTLTLLYAAHDVDHNGALVLRDFLNEQASKQSARRKKKSARETVSEK